MLSIGWSGFRTCSWRATARMAPIFALIGLTPAAAIALEPEADEKARLKACEEQVCRTILDKTNDKKPVACNISKTWAGDKIHDGAKKKKISWSFGDAHCQIKLRLKRADIYRALTKDVFKWGMPEHTVRCVIEEDGKPKPVVVRVGPKVSFKNGRVYKVRLRLKEVKGPTLIKSLIWTTAKLHDNVGLLHGEVVDEMNEFVHKKCEKRYGKKAMERAARKKAKLNKKKAKEQAASDVR